MNNLKDILTDFIELIQRIAYKLDDPGVYYDAQNLYHKIMKEITNNE